MKGPRGSEDHSKIDFIIDEVKESIINHKTKNNVGASKYHKNV